MFGQLSLCFIKLIRQFEHSFIFDLQVEILMRCIEHAIEQLKRHFQFYYSTSYFIVVCLSIPPSAIAHLNVILGVQRWDLTASLGTSRDSLANTLDGILAGIHWPEVLLDVNSDSGKTVNLRDHRIKI